MRTRNSSQVRQQYHLPTKVCVIIFVCLVCLCCIMCSMGHRTRILIAIWCNARGRWGPASLDISGSYLCEISWISSAVDQLHYSYSCRWVDVRSKCIIKLQSISPQLCALCSILIRCTPHTVTMCQQCQMGSIKIL